jgi:hypothetical protein
LRWYKHDDPLAIAKVENGAAYQWVLDHVNYQGDDCIEWPFALSDNGYGRVFYKTRTRVSSQLMCELAHGSMPAPKMQAAHSCGNRKCMNPNHLRWLTRSENEIEKRNHGTSLLGEGNHTAKLNNKSALQVYHAHGSVREIAEKFQVSRTTVSEIKSGTRWSHVTEANQKQKKEA